jgi:tetratricopeptide (TPR) repeat protein
MDAQTLFRDGVVAIKEKRDMAEGRKLLTQALRLDPNNEMAWVWLSRTVTDSEKKLQCLDRALSINPENEQALQLKQRLTETNGSGDYSAPVMAEHSKAYAQPAGVKPPSASEEKRVESLLKQADSLIAEGKTEDAIEQWVRVLEIQVDHPLAMANAVRHLSRLKYVDDAKELVWRAIEAGTTVPAIYLTAIDIARHLGDAHQADDMRDKLARLPTADDETISKIVDYYVEHDLVGRAIEVLEHSLETHPRSQKLLIRMGDLQKRFTNHAEARRYYERAAQLGTRSKEGKEADKKLMEAAPVMSDSERGSMLLAVREAFGFGALYLLMGWQDAGLNLALMGSSRWIGVAISVLGGYLVGTALWSPQQRPLAGILGGHIPEPRQKEEKIEIHTTTREAPKAVVEEDTQLPIIPMWIRWVFGVIGLVILGIAFAMVFDRALDLLANPIPPSDVPTVQELIAEYGE